MTRYFVPQRFAVFAGLLQSSGMLGAMLGQAPLRLAVEQVQWRGAIFGMGALALLLAVAVYLVIPKRSAPDSAATGTTSHGGFSAVLNKPGNWLCVLAGFGLAAPMLAFAALWAVPWLSTVHKFDQTQSASIASMVFLGWLLTAPVAGWISDKLQRRKPVLVTGSVISLLLLTMILKISSATVPVMMALFFFQGAGGCVMVVCFSVMREYNPHGNTSAALGLLNTFVVGSGAVLQPLIGLVLDRFWQGGLVDGARIYTSVNYDRAFMLLIAACVISVICCIFLKESHSDKAAN